MALITRNGSSDTTIISLWAKKYVHGNPITQVAIRNLPPPIAAAQSFDGTSLAQTHVEAVNTQSLPTRKPSKLSSLGVIPLGTICAFLESGKDQRSLLLHTSGSLRDFGVSDGISHGLIPISVLKALKSIGYTGSESEFLESIAYSSIQEQAAVLLEALLSIPNLSLSSIQSLHILNMYGDRFHQTVVRIFQIADPIKAHELQLPPEQALILAQTISHEYNKNDALASIAIRSDVPLEMALNIIQCISFEGARDIALSEIAKRKHIAPKLMLETCEGLSERKVNLTLWGISERTDLSHEQIFEILHGYFEKSSYSIVIYLVFLFSAKISLLIALLS